MYLKVIERILRIRKSRRESEEVNMSEKYENVSGKKV